VTDREHPQKSYAVELEFRTAASFLVAYSVNLSRGGLFVETDADLPIGAALTIGFRVGGTSTTSVNGVVAWRRSVEEATSGPPGIGVEIQDIAPQLGATVDKLATSFRGVHILLLSGDRQDRTTLARNIKSIMATAEITQAADAQVAETVLTHEIDAAIVDVDFDHEGGLAMIRASKAQTPPVPAIAITSNQLHREQAVAAGTDELLQNPPPFADLQIVLVRALAKPIAVHWVDSLSA
jgi:uncharacterized protein (TIGR02266 family)